MSKYVSKCQNAVYYRMDEFTHYISQVGRPYMWAQWLGGLQFLSDGPSDKAKSSMSASHMQETIKQLRRRIRARLSLLKQLASLGEIHQVTIHRHKRVGHCSFLGVRCSSVVRAFAHGAMGRRIDPSWSGSIELFLVPASAPRLV